MTKLENSDNLQWRCVGYQIQDKYLPASCRGNPFSDEEEEYEVEVELENQAL